MTTNKLIPESYAPIRDFIGHPLELVSEGALVAREHVLRPKENPATPLLRMRRKRGLTDNVLMEWHGFRGEYAVCRRFDWRSLSLICRFVLRDEKARDVAARRYVTEQGEYLIQVSRSAYKMQTWVYDPEFERDTLFDRIRTDRAVVVIYDAGRVLAKGNEHGDVVVRHDCEHLEALLAHLAYAVASGDGRW